MEKRTWERVWPPQLPYDPIGLSLEKALVIIEGAKKKAIQLGFNMTFVVCDTAGHMMALQRMDDAALLSLEIAINKARTAVFGKIPTLLWGGTFKGPEAEIPPLHFHSGWITFMGGFPVILDAKIVGGFGSSGATWEDGVIALAGLEAIGADTSGAIACLEDYGVPKEKW